eukprot:m.421931 g.421931  ORF g.421931 m.421931 type:complete len:127 (+) comp35458_c0_seq1:324-704(+)
MSEEDFLDYGDVGESESDGGGAPASQEADQIDLYADLTGASEVSENQESYLEVQQRADAASAKSTKLSRQAALLQKKCDILTKQNTALKKNISCLYKTAKLEIDRKDTEIQRLHAQQVSRGQGKTR